MNNRDIVQDIMNAIGRFILQLIIILILFGFLLCLIAPMFGPRIKLAKCKKYAMFPDYEARAEAEMVGIRIFLWIAAIIGWIGVYCCYHNYYC